MKGKRPMRRHLNYANVIATLALFVALGGTSYAAIRLPAHSVGTRQLKNRAVNAHKLRNGAITPAKLNSHRIGGYTRHWAQVKQGGKLGAHSRGARIVFRNAAVTRLAWGNASLRGCGPIAIPGIDHMSAAPAVARVLASVTGSGPTKNSGVDVLTFAPDGKRRAAEGFTVEVLCSS